MNCVLKTPSLLYCLSENAGKKLRSRYLYSECLLLDELIPAHTRVGSRQFPAQDFVCHEPYTSEDAVMVVLDSSLGTEYAKQVLK